MDLSRTHILLVESIVLTISCSLVLSAQGLNIASHEVYVDIQDVVFLDVVSTDQVDIVLQANFSSGLQAGEAITNGTVLASNSENRLHYTTLSSNPGKQYKISVDVNGIEGNGWDIELVLEPGEFEHSGAQGNIYTSLLSLRFAPAQANLLGGINSVCWTGTNKETQGYQLNYELKITDINNFVPGNQDSPVTITYTLSEE